MSGLTSSARERNAIVRSRANCAANARETDGARTNATAWGEDCSAAFTPPRRAQCAPAGCAMALEQLAHERASRIVERGQRLVEQPQPSVAETEPRERGAPLLARGELLTRRQLVARETERIE